MQSTLETISHANPEKNILGRQTFGDTVAGRIMARRLGSEKKQKYFLYVPPKWKPFSPVFVTVHGIQRQAKRHAKEFIPFADRYGILLVAPLFPRQQFPDYQRLGRQGRGRRADIVLDHILEEVARLTRADTSKLYMFGFSGGAQFTHRYAMAHPRRIERIALASAGWYTYPDMSLKFPRGIKAGSDLSDILLDPLRFLLIPAKVIVGGNDNSPDDQFRTNPELDAQQGRNRLERGRRWLRAMSAAAARLNIHTPFEFEEMPGCTHSFVECMRRGNMGSRVFDFFFGAGS